MMKTLQKIIPRNEPLAKQDAERWVYHTGYWSAVVNKLLSLADVPFSTKYARYNDKNGGWYLEFTDPVTGLAYDIRIKPRRKEKCLTKQQDM